MKPSIKAKVSSIISKMTMVICATLTLLVIYTSFDKYINSPTTLIVSMKKAAEVMFPEFTVCPTKSTGGKFEEKLLNNWSDFFNATFSPEEIIHHISLTLNASATKHDHVKIGPNSTELKRLTRATHDAVHGRCATVTLPTNYIKQKLTVLSITSTMEINVIVHSPNAYNELSVTEISSKNGSFVSVNLAYIVFENIAGKDCSFDSQNNLDKCLAEVWAAHMMESCNCVLPQWGHVDLPMCNSSTITRSTNTEDEPSDKCSIPCMGIKASFGLPYIEDFIMRPRSATTGVALYLSPIITHQKLVYSYGAITMVAEIGGYSSLLLGISALDLSRLIRRFLQV